MNDATNKANDNIYQLLRKKINLKEYCENEIGLNFHKSGNSFRATPATGGTEAFTIWTDEPHLWHNFADKTHGDVIELCALMNHNGDKGAALKELAEKYLNEAEREKYLAGLNRWLKERDAEQETVRLAQTNLFLEKYTEIQHWLEYLVKRGLDESDVKRLGLGYDVNGHWLLIPRFDYDGETVLTHKNRRMPDSEGHEDEKKPKYKEASSNSYVHDAPIGLQTLKRMERHSLLILTEGDFDSFMFEKAGYACLGKIPDKYWTDIISRIENFEATCILAYDTDDAGKGYTKDAINRLFKAGIKFAVADDFGNNEAGEKIKDVNEFVINGGNIADLIANATDGLEYLALSFKPNENDSKSRKRELEAGLKKFLIQAKKRGVDDADLESLYERLIKNGFNAKWLNAVQKKAEKGESESEIVEVLMEKYELLFNERTGFYIYDQTTGIWKQQDDSFIKNVAKEYLGATSSAKKLSAITEHLKAAVVSSEPTEKFNKMPLFGFRNKTLHFKGGLKDFDMADFLTHRVDYDYDPEAKCPEWIEAIKLIFANDEKRIACFQEFCGYCLRPDCKGQEALILRDKSGNGSNGKSTLLIVLIGVFGDKNCTNFHPYELSDNFSKILLKDSKVNICTDCDRDIGGATAALRSAIVGEPMHGCYKNKDIINFTPTAKFIFAVNGSFRVKDIDGAFKRRFLVIDCPVQFIDSGEEDLYHIRKDRNMTEKLMKEKSGIFNWCLAGLKRLEQNGYKFTATDEQSEISTMFMTASETDSVNSFVDYMLENDSSWKGQDFKIAEIFANYAGFCADNDFDEKDTLSNRKFYAAFEARLKAKDIQFKRWRPYKGKESYKF